jgi:hypothetical protein
LFYVAHALLTFFCEKWLLTHDPDDGRFVCSLISSTEADYLCVTGHDNVSQRISADLFYGAHALLTFFFARNGC